jgi:hypothetical protein
MESPEDLDRLTIALNSRIQELIHGRGYVDLDGLGFKLSSAVAKDVTATEMTLPGAVVRNVLKLRTHFFETNPVTKLQLASEILWSLSDMTLPKTANLLDDMRDFKNLAEQQLAQSLLRDQSEDNFRSLLQVALAHQHTTHREVPTGRGKMDLLVYGRSSSTKNVIETKVWDGPQNHEDGILELSSYLQTENLSRGYYAVLEFGSAEHWLKLSDRGDAWSEERNGVTIDVIFVRIPEGYPSQIGNDQRKRARS